MSENTKKHPNSLILGRLFDHQVLDMIEMQVANFLPMRSFGSGVKPAFASRLLVLFNGEHFSMAGSGDGLTAKVLSLFLDFFHGEYATELDLEGLEHVVSITSGENQKFHFRVYQSIKEKSAISSIPRIELLEIGPSFDFSVERTKFAAESLQRLAMRQPRELKPKKKKNVKKDEIGDVIGKVYVKQDLSKLQTRKSRALK